MTERVLSLDISTKTGWALIVSEDNSYELECHGQVPKMAEPEGSYPSNYVEWAIACFHKILELIDRLAPDVLVIEETASGSKNLYSQKILEYIHFLVAKFVLETKIKAVYLMTEQWRRETGCLMTLEEKKHNKQVKQYKDKNKTSIAYGNDGKRVGKIGRKHINIRRANEIFGKFLTEVLRKKDEDAADALMLAYCYHVRKTRSLNV